MAFDPNNGEVHNASTGEIAEGHYANMADSIEGSQPTATSFNGLTGEAFTGGTDMINAWQGLTASQQREVLPHLLDHMRGISSVSDGTSPEDLRAMGQDLRGAAQAFDASAASMEARARPHEILPEDDWS
jgi:hypothetical protein